ncbi:MAG: hypothetical protein ACYDEN_03700 [Acidimicrobiales bacterium]
MPTDPPNRRLQAGDPLDEVRRRGRRRLRRRRLGLTATLATLTAAIALPLSLPGSSAVRVGGPGPAGAAPGGGIAALASRPVRLPRLHPGQRCPVSPGTSVENRVFGGVAFGSGRIGVLVANRVDLADSGVDLGLGASDRWLAVQTVWFARPGYNGPFVVRGRMLGSQRPLRVQTADSPQPGPLEVPAGPTANTAYGYRTVPGATWASAAGCVGWQVDGPHFSERIVVDLLAGHLDGAIETVGGPAGHRSGPLPGTVSIFPAADPRQPDLTVTVRAGQRFSVLLPPGAYTVVARSPRYQSGAARCAGPRSSTVRNGRTTTVTVICPIR